MSIPPSGCRGSASERPRQADLEGIVQGPALTHDGGQARLECPLRGLPGARVRDAQADVRGEARGGPAAAGPGAAWLEALKSRDPHWALREDALTAGTEGPGAQLGGGGGPAAASSGGGSSTSCRDAAAQWGLLLTGALGASPRKNAHVPGEEATARPGGAAARRPGPRPERPPPAPQAPPPQAPPQPRSAGGSRGNDRGAGGAGHAPGSLRAGPRPRVTSRPEVAPPGPLNRPGDPELRTPPRTPAPHSGSPHPHPVPDPRPGPQPQPRTALPGLSPRPGLGAPTSRAARSQPHGLGRRSPQPAGRAPRAGACSGPWRPEDPPHPRLPSLPAGPEGACSPSHAVHAHLVAGRGQSNLPTAHGGPGAQAAGRSHCHTRGWRPPLHLELQGPNRNRNTQADSNSESSR